MPSVQQQPSSTPSLPSVELSADDRQQMENMSDLQKKIFLMRKRVKVYRDGALFNRRALKNPKSDKQYIWVNTKEERRIFFESFDWKVCIDPSVGSNYWRPDEKQHRCADLVLYEIPKELYELMELDKVTRGLDLIDPRAAEQSFASSIRRQGVDAPTFQPKV